MPSVRRAVTVVSREPATGKKLGMLTILLIILIVLLLTGGVGYGGGRYRTGGLGLGGVLLIILLILLLTGAL